MNNTEKLIHFCPINTYMNVRCLNGSAHAFRTNDIRMVTCELCLNPLTNAKFWDEKFNKLTKKIINHGDYIISSRHITTVSVGDIILHNGEVKTVSGTDIKHCKFMGMSIFGDTYNLGYKLVDVITPKRLFFL